MNNKNRRSLIAGALAAMLALPASAQVAESPVIVGSLIDWYYYGKDMHSSDIGWYQQPTGGGAYIDENGYSHPAGEPNIGLLALRRNPNGNPNKPLLPEFLIRNTVLYSNCGGFYTGGNEYYSFFGHEKNASENIDSEYGSEEYEILVRKWTWDSDDEGNISNIKYEQVGTLYNQPTDLAYDPLYDMVYGVFNTGDGYKVGVLDTETWKIKYISREAAPLTGELRTLAINSQGELYGTDKSGNIYHVSKTDGALTYIGSLGFQSQERMMSATFDLRTDKMYWLGFTNNGKNSASTDGTNTTLSVADGGRDTGLYEIDTNTGTATLIGMTEFKDVIVEYDEYGEAVGSYTNQYGKMQLTGLYVEGSITRKNIDQRIVLTSYPAQLKIGQTGQVTVNVKNIGQNNIRGNKYKVELYANGQLVGTIDNDGYNGNDQIYTHDLEKGVSQTLTFDITATQNGTMTLYAKVVNDNDEEQRNNTTEEVSILVMSGKTVPTVNVTGTQNGINVTLNWNAPDGTVTDNIENYAAFSYDNLNDWTLVDGDGGYTQRPSNPFGTVDYPNWNTPKAFIVMDPYKAGLGPDYNISGEKFLPHSGKQYLAAFWTAVPDDGDGHEIDNDDYLVSPILIGDAQTISFWAKGYRGTEAAGYVTTMSFNETLEVLYTTDEANLDPTTYQVAKETFTVNDKEWTEYTAELPAGAKHFALHRNSQKEVIQETELGGSDKVPETGSYVMMIDDITFKVEAQTPTSYKVYKNGTLLATLNADQTSYTGRGNLDNDEYTVVVVYGDGTESMPSNPVGGSTAGIAPVEKSVDPSVMRIYNMSGQPVQHMDRPGLYIIQQNGKTSKVLIK